MVGYGGLGFGGTGASGRVVRFRGSGPAMGAVSGSPNSSMHAANNEAVHELFVMAHSAPLA